MNGARDVAASDAEIVVSEPVPFRDGDTLTYRLIHALEQGQYLREREELESLLTDAGLEIRESEETEIGPGISSRPKIMRFALIKARLMPI